MTKQDKIIKLLEEIRDRIPVYKEGSGTIDIGTTPGLQWTPHK